MLNMVRDRGRAKSEVRKLGTTTILAVVGLLLVAGYFWLAPSSNPVVDAPVQTVRSAPDPGAADERTSDVGYPDETATIAVEQPTDGWTPEALGEVEDLKDWQRAHGYFNASSEFGRLSDTDLEPFLESGDVGALHEMADRRSIKNPKESIAYLEQAAVYGSTAALVRAGQLHTFYANREENVLIESDDSNAGSSMALAYYLAAQMAGDDLAAGIVTEEALNNTEFTNEMKSDACQNAQLILERLQQQRLSIGLSDFDSTPAPRGFGVPPGASATEICGE